MTDQELEQALDKIEDRFLDVNLFYIEKVAEQIQKIGELGQANINRLRIMATVTSDVNEVLEKLTAASRMTGPEIVSILNQAMTDTYTDPRFTRAFSSGLVVPKIQRDALTRYVRAYAIQTSQTMENLSNTTILSQTYRQAVDRAILATTTGLTDYNSAMRDTVRRLGYNGIQVQYPSGYHRRLDTAVRQNILDATRAVSQHCANEVGESLGYDAIELSAHAHSAPDHEPIQGRVFLKEEFEKLQSGRWSYDINKRAHLPMKRAIGIWNCKHFAMPFSTEYSTPVYTEAQLRQFEADNQQGCEIDGKHRTIYEADQMMRKIETEVRRWKDTAVAAQAAGDDTLRRQCQQHINSLVAKYGQISKLSELPQQKNRMTVEGFKMVKLKKGA